MSRLVRSCLAPVVLLAGLAPLPAQDLPQSDPPARHVPVKPAATRQELDHLEAVKLYGLGVMQERGNRLVEALHTFEEAARLDPESATLHRALIPLYLALDRTDDALAACRRTLELDPDDFETGYQYARQLRSLGRAKEALAVLTRTAECPGLKERLDVRAQVFFDLGVLHEEAGDWARAEKALREVVAILDNPQALLEQGPFSREEITAQAAETYERLGRVCLKAKQPDRAVRAFEEARKKDPLRATRLSYNLAEVHFGRGDFAQALERIQDYLRSQPQGMDGYEMRITLQQKLNRQADVVPALEASARADRHNGALQLLLAREYRRAGMADRAESIYTDLLKEDPGKADVYRGLFALYKEDPGRGPTAVLGQLDEALGRATGETGRMARRGGQQEKAQPDAAAAARVRAMLLVLRDDADLVKGLLPAAHRRLLVGPPLKRATRVLLATLASRTGQLDAAEELYRSCLTRPGGPGNKEAEVYAGLLGVLSQAHKHEAIIALCKDGLANAQVTNRLLFYEELAVSHMALGHVKESLAAADDAVRTAGGTEDGLQCRLLRAALLSEAEQHDKAIAECLALLKEYNQAGDVQKIRYRLSGIWSAAGEHDKAEEMLLAVLKEDPGNATANNDLGYLWADRSKNLDEAEKRIRRALELDRQQRNTGSAVDVDSDRDNAAYVDSLGWVLFRKGDLPAARRELERAAALPGGDDDPVVWDHLGDVCFRMRDNARAGQVWKKAIELYESGGGRRRPDERYREIKDKLKLLGP